MKILLFLAAVALVASCTKVERVAGPKVIVTDTIVVHDTVVLPDTDDHHKHHHHKH